MLALPTELLATTQPLSLTAWLLVAAIGAIDLGLTVWALVDIVRRPRVTGGYKWMWVIVVLAIEPIGALVYLALGRAEAPFADATPTTPEAHQRAVNAADVLYGGRHTASASNRDQAGATTQADERGTPDTGDRPTGAGKGDE